MEKFHHFLYASHLTLETDQKLDMYILWVLPTTEVTLQTIWSKFEDFCKPQSNAVCAQFDLLNNLSTRQ